MSNGRGYWPSLSLKRIRVSACFPRGEEKRSYLVDLSRVSPDPGEYIGAPDVDALALIENPGEFPPFNGSVDEVAKAFFLLISEYCPFGPHNRWIFTMEEEEGCSCCIGENVAVPELMHQERPPRTAALVSHTEETWTPEKIVQSTSCGEMSGPPR
jgi:hypothetical protein